MTKGNTTSAIVDSNSSRQLQGCMIDALLPESTPVDISSLVPMTTHTGVKSLLDAVNELFTMKKFFLHDKELEYTSPTAMVIYRSLGIGPTAREEWWKVALPAIKKKHKAKRASVTAAIKTALAGTYCSHLLFLRELDYKFVYSTSEIALLTVFDPSLLCIITRYVPKRYKTRSHL